MSNYGSYTQFQDEVLRERAGPLISPAEDMADEMYHNSIGDQFRSMWDEPDAED